jgi:hypothetical protein
LTFQSESTLARSEMGEYQRTHDVGGFPAYQRTPSGSAKAPFVYFYREFSNWRVGYDYHKSEAVLTSGQTNAQCPSDVEKWYDWKDDNWDEVSDMTLTQGTTSLASSSSSSPPGDASVSTLSGQLTTTSPSLSPSPHAATASLEGLEGNGIGSWVLEHALPCALVCCALFAVVVFVFFRAHFRGKSEPMAHEKELLAHEKLPSEGADERIQKLFAMSHRPQEATGDV